MSDVVTAAPTPGPAAVSSRWNRAAYEFDWISRMLVGGIFVWSGASHLANPYYFLSTVYQYELTNVPMLGAAIASFLPFLELILAVCLLGNICPRPAWFVTSLLLLSFVAVQGSALARGLRISCGCFGPEINRPIDAMSISFTAALAVLSILATISMRRSQLDRPSTSQ
jgi:hypothetical protein